jgi:hypothetical protein
MVTGRKLRAVESYVVHGGCAPLVERFAELVPEDAQYVILDLDRTVHFGVTLGEQLGWEALTAASNAREDAPLEPFFAWRDPVRSTRNLALGLRRWGLAGAIYATTVKLGDRYEGWQRILASRLGATYVDRVQTMLRHVLMANVAGLTREQVDRCVDRAWRRWQQRQVVTREAIDELRRRRPRLQAVVLSSASTVPTVAHAAGQLGVDGFVASEVDLYAVESTEVYSAPAGVPIWFRKGRPEFFSRPGAVVHNAAGNKVALLRERYPEIFASSATAVGITDNNYGEDRTWSEHFAHVVSLNSRHPFSPFVGAASPCRTIQAGDSVPAAVGGGAARFEWLGTLAPRRLDAKRLLDEHGGHDLAMLESLLADLRSARARVSEAIDGSARMRVANLVARMNEAVDHYNAAAADQKAKLAAELNRMAREARRLESRMRTAGRSAARVQHDIEALHHRIARSVAPRGKKGSGPFSQE